MFTTGQRAKCITTTTDEKMNMDKRLLVGAGVFATALVLVAASAALGVNFTGFFKAFDVTLSPGEAYERNITVRMYYNVSVRFQKQGSTSYLTFTDNDSVVVLRSANGTEVARFVGVDNGKIYAKMTNHELDSVATVSAYGIGDYRDVVGQPVNESTISLIGTKAYITVIVSYGSASVSGYIIDDMTGEFLDGVAVAAFDDGADASTASAVVQNVSDANGKYVMVLGVDSSKPLDVYVDGYDVV
jgi:hypothetical protein